MSQKKYLLIAFFAAILFSACSVNKNLPYFETLPKTGTVTTNIPKELQTNRVTILPNDVLFVTVNSLSPESNGFFNVGAMNMNLSSINSSTAMGTNMVGVLNGLGYRVDAAGNINFPVLGTVSLKGLNLDQAREKLVSELTSYIKKPVVNMTFLNFKIAVLGEVARPGTFSVGDDNLNLLDALGLAGDLTPFGRRDNVLVIREVNGQRTMTRLNLNNSDIFSSPFYNLKQNDVVYVEPHKSRVYQNDQTTRFLPFVSALTSIASLVVAIVATRK